MRAEPAQLALERWRRRDPGHEQAAQVALLGWAATDSSALRATLPLPPVRPSRPPARRRVLTGLAVGGIAAGLLTLLRPWLNRRPTESASLTTGRGELRPHQLADGSRLDLGPNSA